MDTYCITDQEATLSDATVADQEHFEQVVVCVHLIHSRHFKKKINYTEFIVFILIIQFHINY